MNKAISTNQNYLPKTLEEAIIIIQELRKEISIIQQQLAILLRDKYGKSSEKQVIIENIPPDNNDSTTDTKTADPEAEETEPLLQTVASYTREARNGHRKIPANLARERIEYKLSDLMCPCGCGAQLHKIGEVITEQLEIIPSSLFVIQHVRFKYAGCINKDKVITAAMPNQPIDKGFAGPGLLADVLIKKYDDHLPLYRQSEIFARTGIKLSRNTLGDWVMQSADILAPLVQAMKPDLLSSPKLHTDDTTIPVLKEEGGPTITGRLWGYCGCLPSCIIYEYSPDRQQKWPIEFLKDYKGYVQADAYPGYDKLFFPTKTMGCRSYLMLNDSQIQMSNEKWIDFIQKDLKNNKIEKTVNIYRYDVNAN